MKNNKKIIGFTLIEVIGVLVIISLLAIIIIPTMTNIFTESKDDMYQKQIEQIELAASNWGSDNLVNMPILDNNEFSITLGTLKAGGYIEQDLINPDTNECFSNDTIIKIIKVNGTFEYEFIEGSGSSEAICTTVDSATPIIYLLGLYEMTVEINTEYEEAGVQALTSSLEITTDIDVTITSDTGYDYVNVQRLGTYTIEYTVEDNGISSSIKRIVNVVDTTAPVLLVNGNSSNYSTTEEFNSSKTFTNYSYTVSDNSEFTGSIYASSLNVDVVSTVSLSAEGSYTVTYTATDYSGNESKIVVTVAVNDTIAPTLVISPTSVSIYDNVTYLTSSITTTSTDTNGTGVASIKFYNGSTVVTDFNTLAVGTYSISVIATDNAGNTKTVVLPVTINVSTVTLYRTSTSTYTAKTCSQTVSTPYTCTTCCYSTSTAYWGSASTDPAYYWCCGSCYPNDGVSCTYTKKDYYSCTQYKNVTSNYECGSWSDYEYSTWSATACTTSSSDTEDVICESATCSASSPDGTCVEA